MKLQHAQEQYNAGKITIHLDDKKDLPKLKEITGRNDYEGLFNYYRIWLNTHACDNTPPDDRPIVKLSDIGEGVKDQFEIDEDKYYESFYSHECGCEGVDSFYYDRTVANGEVWHCKTCNTEIMTPEKPNPDNSKYFTPTPPTPEQTPISRGQGKGNQSITDAGDGWISVKERLPEMVESRNVDNWQESKACVVLIKSKTPEVAILNGNIKDEGDGLYQTWYCPQSDDIVLDVTHWMPLPNPPTNH